MMLDSYREQLQHLLILRATASSAVIAEREAEETLEALWATLNAEERTQAEDLAVGLWNDAGSIRRATARTQQFYDDIPHTDRKDWLHDEITSALIRLRDAVAVVAPGTHRRTLLFAAIENARQVCGCASCRRAIREDRQALREANRPKT